MGGMGKSQRLSMIRNTDTVRITKSGSGTRFVNWGKSKPRFHHLCDEDSINP